MSNCFYLIILTCSVLELCINLPGNSFRLKTFEILREERKAAHIWIGIISCEGATKLLPQVFLPIIPSRLSYVTFDGPCGHER